MTVSIGLRGVGRRFGATWALAGIDLDLAPGVTGLLGPNGAGKTTLEDAYLLLRNASTTPDSGHAGEVLS